MTTKSMVQMPAELYALLEPFSSEERLKIIQATLMLLGEKPLAANRQLTYRKADGKEALVDDPKEYLEQKAPKNKIEQFAVLARFRELEEGITSSMREDFEPLFGALRLDFDKDKFSDDMKHGKEAGLFSMSGNMVNGFTLSAYGQKYVDLLPDRDAVKALVESTPIKIRKPKKQSKKAK